jgi:hypothetical protein
MEWGNILIAVPDLLFEDQLWLPVREDGSIDLKCELMVSCIAVAYKVAQSVN